jgi:hypothetical protein
MGTDENSLRFQLEGDRMPRIHPNPSVSGLFNEELAGGPGPGNPHHFTSGSPMPSRNLPWILLSFAVAWFAPALQGSVLTERLELAHERMLEDRRTALPSLSDPYEVPPAATVVIEQPRGFQGPQTWRRNVIPTVFWIGEPSSETDPTPRRASAWDPNWQGNFGGPDHPTERRGYLPRSLNPGLNPFYVALPYNDLGLDGRHRPEASEMIPWFWEEYRGEGISVCKGRWIAIHHQGRVCYAQWEDVGPSQTDFWQYVFGKETPRPNRNHPAGIEVSPAVRDFLGLAAGSMVEWRFTETREVPDGPWKTWHQLPSPDSNKGGKR